MGYLLIGTAFAGVTIALFFAFFIGFNTAPVEESKAATTNVTIPTGSFIVRMGQSPQTVDNAIKPYGLVYDMIVNYNVPVYWSIEPTKSKDGVDFSYLGLDYRGGPFIIDDMYITPAVYNRLIWWTGQGVNGIFTISDVTVPVYTTLEYFQNIMFKCALPLFIFFFTPELFTHFSLFSQERPRSSVSWINRIFDTSHCDYTVLIYTYKMWKSTLV